MTRQRLSRADWLAAAWEMVAEQGVDRLAVEPLAARLGATKGSFYWHFADRAALLDAVLEDWMQRATRDVITEVEGEPNDARLAALLGHATADRPVTMSAEWAILSAAAHPQIAPVVTRVHAQRIDYLRRLFLARGLPEDRADARARICLAAYLGGMQLEVAGSRGEGGRAAYRDELLRMISAAN